MLAKGLMPRFAALSLAASLVPTTYGAHRFWEMTDARDRTMQRTQFLKNAAMFGGLLMAASQPRRAHKTGRPKKTERPHKIERAHKPERLHKPERSHKPERAHKAQKA
jgi:ATP/maltotriose-dependent transcriptional regulator MalT